MHISAGLLAFIVSRYILLVVVEVDSRQLYSFIQISCNNKEELDCGLAGTEAVIGLLFHLLRTALQWRVTRGVLTVECGQRILGDEPKYQI